MRRRSGRMRCVPIGYVLSMSVLALCTTLAVSPPRPRHSSPTSVTFWLTYLVNELPFLASCWLIATTTGAVFAGDLTTPLGIVGAVLAAVAGLGLAVVAHRGLQARPVVHAAVDETFEAPSARTPGRAGRRSWFRVLVWPFPWLLRGGVRRVRNVSYGPGGRAHRLDVYRPKRRPPAGPIYVHLHGGAFRSGDKILDGQPLINRLVRHGWVCVSANYRVGRAATFPDQLIDVKRVLAWIRAAEQAHGANPDLVVVGGSSAGAHLAAVAALTANDTRFQPAFEHVDTSVRAAVLMYPYPGAIATHGPPSSPHDYVTPDAPPFFVAHGGNDTLVIVDDARTFVEHLRTTSRRPVVYAELPGGQHCFDLFHSLRCEAVIHGVLRFLRAVVAPTADPS